MDGAIGRIQMAKSDNNGPHWQRHKSLKIKKLWFVPAKMTKKAYFLHLMPLNPQIQIFAQTPGVVIFVSLS